MSFRKQFAIAIFFALSLSSAACSHGANPSRQVTNPPAVAEPERVPGQYIIKLADGATLNSALKYFEPYEVKKSQWLMQDYFLIEVTRDPGVARMLEIGRHAEEILNIEPNLIAHTMPAQ